MITLIVKKYTEKNELKRTYLTRIEENEIDCPEALYLFFKEAKEDIDLANLGESLLENNMDIKICTNNKELFFTKKCDSAIDFVFNELMLFLKKPLKLESLDTEELICKLGD